MSRRRLYPFPRLASGELVWTDWSVRLDGEAVEVGDLADRWDANSAISFEISIRISKQPMSRLSIRGAKLAAIVACSDTALSTFADADLVDEGESLVGSTIIEVSGAEIAQELDVRAEVVGLDESAAWLARRIVAEGPKLRVALDSELVGFPTTSSSFDKRGILPAPWRISVTAEALDAPFVHSIRLELNEDYPSVRRLISGRPDAATDAELNASITRVLVATISRLWSEGDPKLEEIAAEHPDSIAAAAQRAAEQRVTLSLSEAVSRFRLRPEELEYAIASKQRMLRG